MEIDLENKFRNWVKRQGGRTYKWYGSKEKLDLIVITPSGTVGLLELKNPDGGGRLSPQQKKIINDVKRKTPGVAVCSADYDECKAWYMMLYKGMFLKLPESDRP